MKKYAFLVYHQQYTHFLEELQRVGVLHVEAKQEGVGDNELLIEKMRIKARIEKALHKAETIIDKSSNLRPATESASTLELLDTFEGYIAEQDRLTLTISNLQSEIDRMRVWGDFSFDKLEVLKKVGHYTHFFVCNESKFKQEWVDAYNAFIISTHNNECFFITVTPEEVVNIEADPFTMNSKTAPQLLLEQEKQKAMLSHNESTLVAWLTDNYKNIELLSLDIEEKIDFDLVLQHTDKLAEETLMVLEGYCPEGQETELEALLKAENIYFEVTDPTFEEPVPIKLKNSFFSRLFVPITNLFSLPNYSELDPTPFLAPFFMLFFGLCFGDGGYGVLVVIAATIAKRKLAPEMRDFASLVQFLGAAAIMVGILTGSFFGIALDSVTWPWLANVKHLFVTGNNYKAALGGYDPMMIFAIVIGLVQIFFGMGVNAAKVSKQHGFKYALGHIGWLVALIMSGVLYGLPMLGVVFPTIVNYILMGIIALSVGVIVFYNDPSKGIIGNIGSGLWNAYNMATGLLGDTLSYIRLFALGLTGSILGGVFNTLAFDLTSGMSPFARWIPMLIILLAGHAINIGLCMIGAFVHPLRLTFVEFYKNAGFEGGGEAYSPFKQKKSSIK